MIELYSSGTPNGWKVSIMLEECALPYDYRPIDIGKGEQFGEAFLRISPNNRIPAIVDTAPADGGAPVSIFESGAILIYLAEKAGMFLPQAMRGRVKVHEWLMWQVGGLGPGLGQNGHFLFYAPERLEYPMARFGKEADRLYGVLDRQLAETGAFVAGADYSIADIACFPWTITHKAQGIDLARFPHVARWFADIRERPAVKRGTAVGRMPRPSDLTPSMKSVLMGIESD